jgi:hypothetical protein
MALLLAIFANLVMVLAVFASGCLLRPFLRPALCGRERLMVMALGGVGLTGVLLFLIGLLSFSSRVIVPVLIVAAVLGIYGFYGEAIRFLRTLDWSSLPAIPFAAVALVLGITFLGGLAEPVGDIKMDRIAYHYLGPQVWLRDGIIHVIPDECHTGFPATVETLYGALIALGGIRAPELFSVTAFGLLLFVSYGFAMRLGLDRAGAWWAVALISAMPVVYRGSYGGFNDAIFSSFVLVSMWLAFDAIEPRDYILPGIFAGMAMGTKYTGIIAFILIVTLVLIFEWRWSARRDKVFAGIIVMAATAAVVAAPWYVRDWIAVGSPIYPPPPVLLHFFHVKYMSPATIDALAATIRQEGSGLGRDFRSFLLLPFHLTFHPANFLNGAGGVGVSLLALAPFGLVVRWTDRLVKILVCFIFLQVVAWFVTEQEARFLIHVYILLAIFAVYGWRWVVEKSPRRGTWLSGVVVACSILYGFTMILPARVDDVHAAFSRRFEEQRKIREIPYLESFRYLNAEPSEKVLVPEPRVATFYLQKNYLKPVGRFGEQTIPEGNDWGQLAGRLSDYGITHILDVRLDNNDFRIPQGQSNLSLVFEREDQRVYRVILSNTSKASSAAR